MELRHIENFDNSGHSWKFQMNGKTHFLTSPGIINDDRIYRLKDNNSSFKIIGGGMLLENDEMKQHRVLFNLESKSYFIIFGENFEQELISI
jgi:hypothetical protein